MAEVVLPLTSGDGGSLSGAATGILNSIAQYTSRTADSQETHTDMMQDLLDYTEPDEQDEKRDKKSSKFWHKLLKSDWFGKTAKLFKGMWGFLKKMSFSVLDLLIGLGVLAFLDPNGSFLTKIIEFLVSFILKAVDFLARMLPGIISTMLKLVPIILKALIKGLIRLSQGLSDMFVNLASNLPEGSFLRTLMDLGAWLLGNEGPVQGVLKSIRQFIDDIMDPSTGIVSAFWNLLTNLLGVVGNVLAKIWDVFAEWFDKLGPLGKSIVIVLAAITAGLLAYLVVEKIQLGLKALKIALNLKETATLGTLLTAMGAYIAAQWASLWPWLAFIAVIALVIAAIYFLVKNWDWVVKKFKEGMAWITEIVEAAWQSIVEFFGGIWDWIKNLASAIWKGIKALPGQIWDGIKSIGAFLLKALLWPFKTIWKFMKKIGKWFSNLISGIWNAITGFASAIWDGIKGVGRAFKGIFSSIWDWIKKLPGKLGDFIMKGLKGIGDVAGMIWDWIKSAFERLWKWVTDKTKAVSKFINPNQAALGDRLEALTDMGYYSLGKDAKKSTGSDLDITKLMKALIEDTIDDKKITEKEVDTVIQKVLGDKATGLDKAMVQVLADTVEKMAKTGEIEAGKFFVTEAAGKKVVTAVQSQNKKTLSLIMEKNKKRFNIK